MARRRSVGVALVAAVVVLAAAWLVEGLAGPDPTVGDPPSAEPPASVLTAEPTEPAPGLPVVGYADLPPQAQETIDRIRAGGPFPYEQDGDVFANRELLLPTHAYGYYREYVVPAPGSGARGPRRIVAGSGGELYYTDDHHESFLRVRRR